MLSILLFASQVNHPENLPLLYLSYTVYTKSMQYYEVSLIKIVRSDTQTLTYSSESTIDVGTIVTVPVGQRTLTGVVIQTTSRPSYAVKSIIDIVEKNPLPPALLATALWVSEYYATHAALVWQAILPTGITSNRRKQPSKISVHKRDRTPKLLTDEQLKAIETINATPKGSLLLHGVTGSGKTLVYIEAAKQSINSGMSVVILVPEIALTSQLVADFSNHFPEVILAHSRQTEAERHLVWRQALLANTPQIVIGPRSALFLPLKRIGLIVIDECHEPSFKQEQSPRYSALRVASILAKNHHAKTVLGSATPAISDYYLAAQTKQPIIQMPSPARRDTVQPDTQIIDMTNRANFTEHPFLSNQLLTALRRTLENRKQSLLFHNRRGTASVTMCQNCGWQAGCPRCFIPLTLHADQHWLSCHICGLQSRVPTSCPECQTAEVVHKGIGTKRIESEIKRLFPGQRISRFDADTASGETIDRIYDELYNGNTDIIIGTQVVAKGLDLPHLRTVGIIQADAGLDLPDYTSPERTFQLLSQVVGRVGRSRHQTQVVIQSYQPSHPAIQNGATQNYANFYDRSIALRRHANFPPFCHLLKLVCIYKTEKTAVAQSRRLAALLRQQSPEHIEVFGPAPAFYERVRDTYRWQLVVKSPRRQDLVDLLKHIPKTNWQFELDPASLL